MRSTLVATALMLGALGALSGCHPGGGAAGRPAAGSAHTAESVAPTPDALVGDYDCRFSRGGQQLPPAPCAIRGAGDGTLRLEQAGGALRVTGAVTPDEAGFRVAAQIACDAAPCPAPGTRELVFFAQAAGVYAAVVPLDGGGLLDIDVARRP